MERVAVYKNDKDVLSILTLSRKESLRLGMKLFLITKGQLDDVKDPSGIDLDRFVCDEIKELTFDGIKKLTEKNIFTLMEKEMCKRDLPANTDYFTTDLSNVPDKDHLRMAWGHNGKEIIVDMEKAKPLHMAKIRDARDKKLQELDYEYMIAERNKDNNKVNSLSVKRNKLLNVPQDCESQLSSISDADSLRSLWHVELEN